MVKIFSCGNLCKKEVHRQVFDTTFIVFDDEEWVKGWITKDILIDGTYYKMAVEESDDALLIGTIINVPDIYMEAIDQYEGENYMRINITTISDKKCQMYVKRS